MRTVGRAALPHVLNRNPEGIFWVGLIIGLLLCFAVIYSEGLTFIQKLHLSLFGVPATAVVHEKSAGPDGRYYFSCSFLVLKGDNSRESLFKKAEITDRSFQLLRPGSQVEVLYSSRQPTEVWMLKSEAQTVAGSLTILIAGIILMGSGIGGIVLMSR